MLLQPKATEKGVLLAWLPCTMELLYILMSAVAFYNTSMKCCLIVRAMMLGMCQAALPSYGK
jgi:hypothetical protein